MERCRICFAIHTSLEVLGEVPEKDFLKSLFIKEQVNEQLSSFLLCYECKALLKKSCKFIQKALNAQRAFLVLQNQSANTDVWVSFVNELGLNSTLSYHNVGVNLFLQDEELLHEDEIDSKELLKDLVKVEIPSDIDQQGDCNDNQDVINKKEKPKQKRRKTKFKPKHIKQETNSEDEEFKPYKMHKKHKQNKQNQNESGKQNPKRKRKPRKYEKSKITEVVPDNILSEKRVDAKAMKFSEPQDEGQDIVLKYKGYKSGSESDVEFIANNELLSSESESSYDSYDDNGKKLKKPPRKYPRQCDHCDTEIETGKSHYRHYLDHHSHDLYPYRMEKKVCTCKKCGYEAKNKYVLKQHVLTHGEKTKLCPDCGKSFYNTVALGKHRYNFHRGRRFVCDYCKKAFQTASVLKLHVRIHTGEKPYKCDSCDSSFATRGNLNSHMRNIHEKVDKDGKPVAKKSRKRKCKSTEESNKQDTHERDRNTRKNKTKKTKQQAKVNENDIQDKNSKNQEFNNFNDGIPMKDVNKKGKRVTFQTDDVVSSNDSKKQETDDDDDVPLKTMKNMNLIELKNVQPKDFDNDINNLESTIPQTMDQTTMDYITQELF